MVAGYLSTQSVDIGSQITKGQVLAVIDVPRVQSLATEARSLFEQAAAQALQAESKVDAVAADRDATAAAAAQCIADIDRLIAQRRFAEAQYKRVKRLSEERAIDMKVVDERKWELDTAVAAEKTGRLAAETAASQLAAAEARVVQARADVKAAQAAVAVAEARLRKVQVDLDYSKIAAPFNGVVTRRNFHPGAYIAPHSGSNQPALLSVSRTDLMRVVVQVPDRDAPSVNPGDPAVLRIDGLENREFKGQVSRIAEFEDPKTRTMRVEVDLPNPEGVLRDGMYATVNIQLEIESRQLTVPAVCIHDRTPKGGGFVYVVRDDAVERIEVSLGREQGADVEVRSGLAAGEMIVVGGAAGLTSGMKVEVQSSSS
jgi:RND family efflux transporter MFP subunit